MARKNDIVVYCDINKNNNLDTRENERWTIYALFACLIIRTFLACFFYPEQCFSLTTNQPEQCFDLFFQRSERGIIDNSHHV